ncbi:MAG TPA: YpdA family putative bacillithiol disulfide reductase [Gemmatimonadales bacterium]|nr:YpdA family putative bacillithiol disulfide reductase [Gemmatimonadales bacterium]
MNTLPAHVDVLVVGAGPIGLAVAISATRRGHVVQVIDAGPICASIVRYPVGMTFFTTPERLEIGGHPLACSGPKATREEALMYYRGVVRAERLAVRTYARLTDAERTAEGLRCAIATPRGTETLLARRLILATGYFEHANQLGIDGEDLPHVSHWFAEPHTVAGQDVVVVGGKNSAIEAALAAWRVGARVTLVHRRPELAPGVKYWLRPDFDNRVAAGEITAHFASVVTAITPSDVAVQHADGTTRTVPADRVFLLTGYHPDFALLRRLGIALDPETDRPQVDPATLETNVPGLYLAGSVAAGRRISEVFIENGRYDGEKIFGDAGTRAATDARYARERRVQGE